MYNRQAYPRNDSSPPRIKALREKLCAGFIANGEFDPDTLTALAMYAKSMRGERSDARKKKPDDISVRPVTDSISISPKYAAYLERQRAVRDRNERGGPDEPTAGAT
jgi:hypothetical protein